MGDLKHEQASEVAQSFLGNGWNRYSIASLDHNARYIIRIRKYIYIYIASWYPKQPNFNGCLVKQPFLMWRFWIIQLKQPIENRCLDLRMFVYINSMTKSPSIGSHWYIWRSFVLMAEILHLVDVYSCNNIITIFVLLAKPLFFWDSFAFVFAISCCRQKAQKDMEIAQNLKQTEERSGKMIKPWYLVHC